MNNQDRPQGSSTEKRKLKLSQPNNLTQITTNDFVKNILKKKWHGGMGGMFLGVGEKRALPFSGLRGG